jgi:hypothetical protein
MTSYKRTEEDPSQPPTPPRWKGADSLELVYRLNERVFTLAQEGPTPHRDLWRGLSAQAIERAARFPFLIVDVHFTDEPWWRSVVLNPQGVEEHSGVSVWPAEVAGRLMSEVLVFAWHTAKWDTKVARLVLGMLQGVGEIVRGLAPQQLDAVSRLRSGALHLRWQEDQEFWARLAQAARRGDGEALADIHLHAKLLLSGELMQRSGSSKVEK